MRLLRRAVLALVLLALLAAGVLWHLNYNDGVDIDAAEPMAADAAVLARGAYLARAGNCLACHTARGGVPAAGGKPIATPTRSTSCPACKSSELPSGMSFPPADSNRSVVPPLRCNATKRSTIGA